MPSVLDLRLTGGAANADPNLSLGGITSAETVAEASLNNLFSNVSNAQRLAGLVSYRAVDLVNTGDLVAAVVEIFMSVQTVSPDSHFEMGLGDITDSIDDEETAPTGIVFVHHLSGNPLAIPDISVGEAARVWIKRVIAEAASNYAYDGGTISWTYA